MPGRIYFFIQALTGQIADLQEINATNVRIKAAMEQQLIGHQDSIGKIYQITSRLEQQMPEEVLFDAVEMMKELLHTEDVAIYSIANQEYARLFSKPIRFRSPFK